jgi:putative ABC transport system permease protein
MFRYYVWLAIRSLRRNPILTALMVAAIGLGIGASMTTLTIFRAMSGDPIPDQSPKLFVPQIDNWGPDERSTLGDLEAPDQLSYTDANALMQAHMAPRQAAMYATYFVVTAPDPQLRPFQAEARATYADFFPIFEVPFRYGAPWGAREDEERSDVAVIDSRLNDQLFGGANSVGKTIRLDEHDYRIVGVMAPWNPEPRVYDVISSTFNQAEQIYVPFTRAIEQQQPGWGNNSCSSDPPPGWDGHLHSECVWLQFWVELPDAAAVQRYAAFLDNYAAEQQRNGRFHWPPFTRLRSLHQWMKIEHVVTDESRILVVVSFGFLLVCLLNAVGLMLAKFMNRAGETGVRRALGADRRAVFAQCLVETGVIGLSGGLLGLLLTAAGLAGARAVLSEEIGRLAHMDLVDVLLAVTLAVVSAVLAGLYPTWRATLVQPAWQLKTN